MRVPGAGGEMNLPDLTGLSPLAVWDCEDRGGVWWRDFRECCAWAVANIRNADSTFRIDFYLVDAPFAVVYRDSRDEAGKLFTDPATGEIARDEPVVQLLTELPPSHLLHDPCGG
jgi:hypothetical protein